MRQLFSLGREADFAHAVQWSFSRTPESNFKSNYLPLKSWKKSWKAPESNFHSMFSGPKSWIISWNIEYPEGNLWIKCSTQCSTFTPRKLGRGVGFPTPRPTFRGWKVGQWVEHQMGADAPHDMQQNRRCLLRQRLNFIYRKILISLLSRGHPSGSK